MILQNELYTTCPRRRIIMFIKSHCTFNRAIMAYSIKCIATTLRAQYIMLTAQCLSVCHPFRCTYLACVSWVIQDSVYPVVRCMSIMLVTVCNTMSELCKRPIYVRAETVKKKYLIAIAYSASLYTGTHV